LAENCLGEMVLPEGWTEDWKADSSGVYDYSAKEYTHPDGRTQSLHPGKPEGIIALAAVIPGMRALTRLDISKQVDEDGDGGIGAEGAKCLAEALKNHP
jgi:hypothetical protein